MSVAETVKALPGRALDMWFAPVSPNRIRFFERVFAMTFIIYIAEWIQNGYEWLTPRGYHVSLEHQSSVYPDPWPLLPESLLPLFGVLLFGSATAVVLGLARRPALWLCFACAFYIQSADLISAFTLNKLFIVTFFVLAIQPAAREVKLEGTGETVLRMSAWPIRIIQGMLVIQYGTAGTCKIFHGDWMQNPDVLYTHAVGLYRTDFAAWVINNFPHFTWPIMGYSALAFEALAPVLFLVRKLRPVAFVWGYGFQLTIAAMMKDLIFFSLQMMSFYLLFLPEAWVVRWEESLQRRISGAIDGFRGGSSPPAAA